MLKRLGGSIDTRRVVHHKPRRTSQTTITHGGTGNMHDLSAYIIAGDELHLGFITFSLTTYGTSMMIISEDDLRVYARNVRNVQYIAESLYPSSLVALRELRKCISTSRLRK